MNKNSMGRKAWLRRIGAMILLAGLGSAVLVYQAAPRDENSDQAYEIIGGKIYPSAGNTKKYVHDLKLYGGEAAVIADQFDRWFSGLWQGTSLAYTIAVISSLVAAGFFLAARYLPPE